MKKYMLTVLFICAMLTPVIGYGVTKIIGGTAYGPILSGPGTGTALCSVINTCADFWDVSPTEGNGTDVFYGSHGISTTDVSCRKSTDGGVTFSLCPTNYPVTGVFREIDISGDGSILSARIAESGNTGCRIDKSTDGGNSWTTITVVAGANLQCAQQSVTFPGEHQRCQGAICLTLVRSSSTGDTYTYRSTDNGDTWALVDTLSAATAPNCGQIIGVYMDDANAFVSCHRYLTGQTGLRVSSDYGQTWSKPTAPANLDYCGPVTAFQGEYALPCGNSGLTGLRLLATDMTVTTPTQPAYASVGGSFNPSSVQYMIQRDLSRVYLFYLSTVPENRWWFSNDGGQTFIEPSASVDGTFRPVSRVYNWRSIGGTIIWSANSVFYTFVGG